MNTFPLIHNSLPISDINFSLFINTFPSFQNCAIILDFKRKISPIFLIPLLNLSGQVSVPTHSIKTTLVKITNYLPITVTCQSSFLLNVSSTQHCWSLPPLGSTFPALPPGHHTLWGSFWRHSPCSSSISFAPLT